MTYIPAELRRLVHERAGQRCEYCRLHEADAYFSFEIDHIIAEKHGGATSAENLCLSRFECNRYKGSDIASYDTETDDIVPLYHPRRDSWDDHFQLEGPRIMPLSAKGRVTVRLLQLNAPERLPERERLIALGGYPT